MAPSNQDASSLSFINSNSNKDRGKTTAGGGGGGSKLPLETLALFEDVRVRVEYVTSPIAQSRGRKYLDSGLKEDEMELSSGEEEEDDNVSINSLAETQLERKGRKRRRRALLAKAVGNSSRTTSSSCPNYKVSSSACRKTGNGDESLALCHEKRKREGGGEGCGGRRVRIPPPLSGRQPLTLGHKESDSVAPICEGKKGRKNRKGMSNSIHHHHHHLHEDGGGHDHHLHCYRSSRVKQPFITVSSPSRSPVPITPPSCFGDSQDEKVSIGTMTSSQRRKRREQKIINNNSSSRNSSTNNRLERQNTFGQGEKGFIRSFLRRTVSSGDGNSTSGGDGVRRASASMILAQEKKAAKQLGVIVGAFIFCWLPYFILFMAVAYCGVEGTSGEGCVDQTMFTATVWFGYFNSALNPVLYPMCNANFKRAFKQMLGIKSSASASSASRRNNNNNNGSQYNNHNNTIKKKPS